MYFADTQCSITIRTNKRVWMSIEYFQSNSSSSFPRCTEAKYAGIDDRLQIIDVSRIGVHLMFKKKILFNLGFQNRFDSTDYLRQRYWSTFRSNSIDSEKFDIYNRLANEKSSVRFRIKICHLWSIQRWEMFQFQSILLSKSTMYWFIINMFRRRLLRW